MNSLLKGGLYGLIAFIVFFIVLSLINIGEISISDAFNPSDPWTVINYGLVLIFVVVGVVIGGLYSWLHKKRIKN